MTPKPRDAERLEIMQGTLDLIILRTLRWGPMHGHGIAKFIQQTSGDTFKIEHGSLYPALQRLLQERWIAAEWGTLPPEKRAKIIEDITRDVPAKYKPLIDQYFKSLNQVHGYK